MDSSKIKFKGHQEAKESTHPKVLVNTCAGEENCKTSGEVSEYISNKLFVLMANTNTYDPESYETSPVKQQMFPFF